MSVPHKPAAAWSRDSLAAWQYMADSTDPKPRIVADPKKCHIEFLRRWASKILTNVYDEMDFCDWYWFLSNHFDTELKRLDQHIEPISKIAFTASGEFEPDPVRPRWMDLIGVTLIIIGLGGVVLAWRWK